MLYHKHEGSHLGEFIVVITTMMMERVIRRMIVKIVNISPIVFIVIVQQADWARTEKHDGDDSYSSGKFVNKSTLYPAAPIRTASVHRIENHGTRPFLFPLLQIYILIGLQYWNQPKKSKNKCASGPTAATCRLGSWRPTGEVPLHLGRAVMMMHTSWSLASDTPLKIPVHIFSRISPP